MPIHNPLVSVCMETYNHEKYIREAINGVLIQQCNFEYELIISNDASVDETDNIIREIILNHPKKDQIKYFNHSQNMGMMANFVFALNQCSGKYIAICEGDDYWIDENKLQKQVDFLETNKEYIICGTDASQYSESTKEMVCHSMRSSDIKDDFVFDDFTKKNNLITATVLYRNIPILKNLPSWIIESPYGDWALYLILTKYGKAKNLNFVSAVYRQHGNGVFSGANSITNQYRKVLMYNLILKEFHVRTEEIVYKYRQLIYWVYNDTTDRKMKMEMIKKYLYPFRVSVFFNSTFLSMLRRYYVL